MAEILNTQATTFLNNTIYQAADFRDTTTSQETMFLNNTTSQATMLPNRSTSQATMSGPAKDMSSTDAWITIRIVLTIVIFLGGCTNSLLAMIGTLRLSRKWTPEMILMIDFCVSNLTLCFFIGDQIVRLFYKPFFHIMYCQVSAYLQYVSGGNNIVSHLLITVYRYTRIIFPHNTNLAFRSIRKTVAVISMEWCFTTGFFMLPLFKVWGRFGFEPANARCHLLIEYSNYFERLVQVLFFIVPILTLIYCYVHIFYVVRKQRRVMAVNEPADNQTTRQQVASSNITKDPHSSGPRAKPSSSAKHRSHLIVPSTSRRGTEMDFLAPPPRALHQRSLGKKGKKREFTPRNPLSEGTSRLAREKSSRKPSSTKDLAPCRILTSPPGRVSPAIRALSVSHFLAAPGPRTAPGPGTTPSLVPPAIGAQRMAISTSRARKHLRREVRLSVVAFSLIMTFILCLMPYIIASTLRRVHSPVHRVATDMVWILMYIAINPLIYILGDRRIKKKLLCKPKRTPIHPHAARGEMRQAESAM